MSAESKAHSETAQLNEITGTTTARSTEDGEHRSAGGRKVPQVVIWQKRNPPGGQAQGHHNSRDPEEESEKLPDPGRRDPTVKRSSKQLSRSQAARSSRRLRGQKPEHDTSEGGSVFTMIAEVYRSTRDQLDEFLDTFWPDHPEDQESEKQFKAVYAVIAHQSCKTRNQG